MACASASKVVSLPLSLLQKWSLIFELVPASVGSETNKDFSPESNGLWGGGEL